MLAANRRGLLRDQSGLSPCWIKWVLSLGVAAAYHPDFFGGAFFSCCQGAVVSHRESARQNRKRRLKKLFDASFLSSSSFSSCDNRSCASAKRPLISLAFSGSL